MRAKSTKIAMFFLVIFVVPLLASANEDALIGKKIIIEKGVIRNLSANSIMKMKNAIKPNEIAKFGFPEKIVENWTIIPIPTTFENWAIIPIPTEFRTNVKLIEKRK